MRALSIAVLLSLGVALAVPAPAQQVVRIAAVVNDDVISMRDFLSRLKMVVIMSRLPDTPEVRQRVAPDVLRTLIDEKLEIQEAKRLGLSVDEKDIKEALASIESRNNLAPGKLKEFLVRQGIEPSTVIHQVRATLAWNRVIRQRIRPTVRISEEEIDEVLARIRANRSQPQYLVSEIFLGVDTPDDEDSVRALARRLVEQIRTGANFASLARQFSQSATAAVGGDLGWIRKGESEPEVEAALASMKPGQVMGPVRSVSGYHILALRDRRTVAATKPENVTVSLAQVVLRVPAEASPEDVASQKKLARTITETASGCDDMKKIGEELGVSAGAVVKDVKVSDIAADIQPLAMQLPVGRASDPVRRKDGFIVVMVCTRTGEADLPSREEVRRRIGSQRLDLLTRRYLRDLRRAAFLDVRV